MKAFIIITTLCIGCPSTADAQTFTQRLQKKSNNAKGTVTIHQSAAIDKLVNNTDGQTVISYESATAVKPSTATTANKSNTVTTTQEKPATTTTTPSTSATLEETPTEVDTRKKMPKNFYKVIGYRVQVFAGGNSRQDKLKAERIGNEIKQNFPNAPTYVHFYSPRWICRVGNYRTYEEAHQMLLDIKKLGYSQATIVKGRITVSY